MTAEVLHKLNSFFHLLPKLNMSINASCYHEIGFCHDNMCDNVPVHVALLVTFRVWQIFQIKFLVM